MVETLSALELAALPQSEVRKSLLSDPASQDNLIVEYKHTAGPHSPEGQLLVTRRADLALNQDVQRLPYRPGNLGCHRHTSTRESQHQHVPSPGELIEMRRQFTACFYTIGEESHTTLQFRWASSAGSLRSATALGLVVAAVTQPCGDAVGRGDEVRTERVDEL
jgi:hypothetical protein